MSMQQKAHKYRIYPTKLQQDFLAQQFGAVRFVYNHFLYNRNDEYLNNKKSSNYFDDAKSLTKLKATDDYQWLYDINAQTLQASLRNLEVAYGRFFKKQSKFPRFHKRGNKQCIKIPQAFSIKNNKIYIPKLKTGIEIVLHQSLPEKQTCCFISKTTSGKYYASFLCEVDIKPLKTSKNKIGIDLGIKDLIITSNGETVANQNLYRKAEKEISYQQKLLSKKQKGSHNKEKQRKELAKINEYIANCRKDYLHKTTKKLIDENQVIIAESLAVKNMMQNHCLSKSIQDASWGEIIRQLEYKAKWYGRTFHQIDRFFPSSKTCNNCQYICDNLPLNIREWTCPNCKQHNDRDVNAAKNIRDKGLADLKDLSGCGIQSDVKQKLVKAPRSKMGRRNKKPSALC